MKNQDNLNYCEQTLHFQIDYKPFWAIIIIITEK